MYNSINKFLDFFSLFFFSYLFFIPCNFFIIHNYYLQIIIFCASILFFYLLDKTKQTINSIYIGNKIEVYQKKIIFFSAYFFLILKQFFIVYCVFKISSIYAPKIAILYVQTILLFLYNLFIIITDDQQNNFIIIFLELLTCGFFLAIIFLEYNISYELLENFHSFHNNNFIHWINYFVPFFLLCFYKYEDQKNTPIKYVYLPISNTFIFIIMLYLKNKLYAFFFTKNDFFANIIIKNYTICPILIHIFYLFLLCYIFYQGYQTYQKQLKFQIENTYKIILIINTIIFTAVLSNYLISLKIIINIIYLFILIKYLIYSIIIYNINKRIYDLLFYFIIFICSMTLLLI
jgi:hypothetical protein